MHDEIIFECVCVTVVMENILLSTVYECAQSLCSVGGMRAIPYCHHRVPREVICATCKTEGGGSRQAKWNSLVGDREALYIIRFGQ